MLNADASKYKLQCTNVYTVRAFTFEDYHIVTSLMQVRYGQS
jgi:hypothetical protein